MIHLEVLLDCRLVLSGFLGDYALHVFDQSLSLRLFSNTKTLFKLLLVNVSTRLELAIIIDELVRRLV